MSYIWRTGWFPGITNLWQIFVMCFPFIVSFKTAPLSHSNILVSWSQISWSLAHYFEPKIYCSLLWRVLLVSNYVCLIVVHSSSYIVVWLCAHFIVALAVRLNPWKDVSTLEFITKSKKNTSWGVRKLTERQLNLLLLPLETEKQKPRIKWSPAQP